MTVPVRTHVHPGQGPFCKSNFSVSFFVPFVYQNGSAPAPTNDAVYLETTPAMDVYVTSFGGFALSPVVTAKAKNLTDVLEGDGKTVDTVRDDGGWMKLFGYDVVHTMLLQYPASSTTQQTSIQKQIPSQHHSRRP